MHATRRMSELQQLELELEEAEASANAHRARRSKCKLLDMIHFLSFSKLCARFSYFTGLM
jgi:hypothetical protein